MGQGFPQQWKYGRRGGLFKISEMAGVNAWGSMWVASKTGENILLINQYLLICRPQLNLYIVPPF